MKTATTFDLAFEQAQEQFTQGNFCGALQAATAALMHRSDSAPALSLVANAANALGEFDAAIEALAQLVSMRRGDVALRAALAMALNNAGVLRYRRGEIDAAVTFYGRTLELEPHNKLALFNLATAAENTHRLTLAQSFYAQLHALDPNNVDVLLGVSRVDRALGYPATADAALHAAERAAASSVARLAVATESIRCGDFASAGRLLPRAQLDDDTLRKITRLQSACNDTVGAEKGLHELARRARQAHDLKDRFRAERDLALLLPRVCNDVPGLETARHIYTQRIEALIAAWPASRIVDAKLALEDLTSAHFTLAYQGGDDRSIALAYGDWLASAAQTLWRGGLQSSTRPVKRIGFVCARLTQGTVAAYFGSWVGALCAAGFEVTVFSLGDKSDATSAAIVAQASHSQPLSEPLHDAADQLRQADQDLLIYPEIGLDPAVEVLAALRIAPRQWAAWGHPVTTGLPTIDRFISVAAMEPDAGASHYREKLLLLPGLGTLYAQPRRAAFVSRENLGLPPTRLYGVPHSPGKLHPNHDALLLAIAQRDETAQFVCFEDELPALSRAYRARIGSLFSGAELDPTDYFVWLPRMPIDTFRSVLAQLDVVVDSLYFSGGNTSLDALAQGTPVVTIAGAFMRGRQTGAMLDILGVSDCIAADLNEAARIAIRIANDGALRAALGAKLLAQARDLFDRHEPVNALVAHIRAA